MNNTPVWMGICSGNWIDVANPRVEDISIEDIAWSLANIKRFNGHLATQISVAQHSVQVSRRVPAELQLAALLHDAPEAYLGDVTRPVKRFLKQSGVDLDNYERFWQHLIWNRYGCKPTSAEQESIIAAADDLQLAFEIISLAPPGPFQLYGHRLLANVMPGGVPEQIESSNADPQKDYTEFRDRFFQIFPIDAGEKER